jgi:hypothetical protein
LYNKKQKRIWKKATQFGADTKAIKSSSL